MSGDRVSGEREQFTDGERSSDALASMRYDRLPHEPDGVAAAMRRWLDRVVRVGSGGRVNPALAIGLAGVVLVAVVVAVVLVRREPTDTAPPVTVPPAAPVSTTVPLTPTVVVQAVGAVRIPGVYRLPVGARVVDLLERAGGPTAEFDGDRVNLAALVTDGERVWVPRIGETPPLVAGGGAASSSGAPSVDVNHATVEQLDSLPGIGRTLASAIIADRQRRGPFRTVDDLLRVKGMNRSKVDALRELVVLG